MIGVQEGVRLQTDLGHRSVTPSGRTTEHESAYNVRRQLSYSSYPHIIPSLSTVAWYNSSMVGNYTTTTMTRQVSSRLSAPDLWGFFIGKSERGKIGEVTFFHNLIGVRYE